jgi:hypothetical protein
MTTRIVVANRSGLAASPDGSKYRLAAGRTLADERHPLVTAYPDLFSPYEIHLPYEGDEPDGPSAAERGDVPSWPERVAEVEATAEGYREQLAAIAEDLHTRGLVPADIDTSSEGWLAALIADILDRSRVEDAAPAPEGKLPEAAPDALPKPRKRAPRPKPADE